MGGDSEPTLWHSHWHSHPGEERALGSPCFFCHLNPRRRPLAIRGRRRLQRLCVRAAAQLAGAIAGEGSVDEQSEQSGDRQGGCRRYQRCLVRPTVWASRQRLLLSIELGCLGGMAALVTSRTPLAD